MVKIYKQVEVVTTQIFVVGIESEVLTEEGLKEFSDTISYVEEVDDYGNPVSGDRIINCCFPDCGCDGARCCQAENGANSGACSMNIERGTIKF